MVITSAPGRICIAGDNIDWMNGSVITAALVDLRIHVSVETGEKGWIKIHYGHPYNMEDYFQLDDLSSITLDSSKYVASCVTAIKQTGCDLYGLNITIKSSIPKSGGLASSGAFCVALIGALSRQAGMTLTSHEIAEMAYVAEREKMEINCGQMDQYSVALGGILFMNCASRPPHIEKLHTPDNVVVIVGYSELNMRFSDFVIDIKQRWKQKEASLVQYAKLMEESVYRVRQAMIDGLGNQAEIGQIVNTCQKIINGYEGFLNPTLDKYIQSAREAGAYCAKSSGTRTVGGSMFALCSSEQAEEVARAIRAVGGKTVMTRFEEAGLRHHSE